MSLRISVVTPSFNQARFLEATLRSIHDPGYPNLEHVVIDGGSTDGSVDILRKHEGQLAYWVSEQDRGQTDALIKGFRRATGDIFCWLNSDDLFEPHTLFEVADYFARHPQVDFIYGDSRWIDAKGRFVKSKREHGFIRFIWMYHHNFIPQPSAFWRRHLYEAVGGLDPTFDLAMDADLWIRFADISKPRHVRRPWSAMRIHAEQKNTRLRSKTRAEGRMIRARYLLPQRAGAIRLKRRLARVARVGMRLITGCYSLTELFSHFRTLVGHGTWEQREVARQSADKPLADHSEP